MNILSFKSFLSHRYKSSDVNLYFFNLFSSIAEVQFEIDNDAYSISVTKIEKMIRDSDAFIGIYPYIELNEDISKQDKLLKQSKYFRLELDLAIRSQKPAIIFYDKRYGNLIKPPENILSCIFDYSELTSTGGFPSYNKHINEFEKFCNLVARKKNYDDIQVSVGKTTIALVTSSKSYENLEKSEFINQLKSILEKNNYNDVELIEIPTSLNNNLFRKLEKIDFAIVDNDNLVSLSGVIAFLHGRFIPTIRLENINELNNNELNKFLFEGVEVGFNKDLIKWENKVQLFKDISQKIEIINSNIVRINTFEEANKYFISATLRKDAVFVSYSGKDLDTAKDIINELKKHFQYVFDYRDGSSIEPGKSWMNEIFDKISICSIGINLISNSYIESGNCIHEAQHMVAQHDNNKMKLLPIKLYEESISLPEFIEAIQYIRRLDYKTTNDLIKVVIKLSEENQ